MSFRLSLFILVFLVGHLLYAQSGYVKGKIVDKKGNPIEYATISLKSSALGVASGKEGTFTLAVPAGKEVEILIKFLGYKEKNVVVSLIENQIYEITIVMEEDFRQISQVDVNAIRDNRTEAGLINLDPKNAVVLPSAFGDFNKIIALMPGVVSNNELSSTYSVRGGNYDENLIYVNGIEVYRPFLVRSGQQEGLSFVNPALASGVSFSSGGWQAKYGDKLSSVMNVSYKEPKKFEGSATFGLLGGTIHLGGTDKNQRVSYVVGFRNKTSKYLLNTLPTQGQYLPSFNDLQSYINIDLTNRKKSFPIQKRTTLGILGSYAGNRYDVIPQSQETNFGTASQTLNLTIGFDGTEQMNYDTWQNGLKFSHWTTGKFKTEFYASAIDSREREFVDLQAGYRLCDVSPDPSGARDYNKCASERGVDSTFRYDRNTLHAQIYALENRSYYYRTANHTIEFGARYSKEIFNDVLYEYALNDSLGYTSVTSFSKNNTQLNTNRFSGYIQSSHKIDTFQTLTYGIRIGYWDLNQQILISPSIQYSFKPHWKKDVVFRTAAGIYRQPPFYRELRNFQGIINPGLRAQSSAHFIAGTDYRFSMWEREFKFTSELYFKYLWDVVPYDIDNVRIRYYAQNSAIAYAAGLDMRVSGEFLKGDESWFSLSIMQTKEKVDGSPLGWIRRPTDQRVTFACFFQDHIPGNPSLKVFINMIFGTGLPFGIPNNPNYRDAFNIPPYRRIDLGFTKVLKFNDKEMMKSKFFKTIMISLEVLNVLGVNNTLSYIWVADYQNNQYAVPNTLSQRFLNAKILANF